MVVVTQEAINDVGTFYGNVAKKYPNTWDDNRVQQAITCYQDNKKDIFLEEMEERLIQITQAGEDSPELVLAEHLHAGFPSPAADYTDRIDITQEIIRHPDTTFYARIEGESMRDVGIFSGALAHDRMQDPAKRTIDEAAFKAQSKYSTFQGYLFHEEWMSYEE